ncbi:hypothetical protein MO973_05215 [Paenibacillus sp. TRM 82003]|nr:hypothetical protein [Paenibacillus sp. TRM 82003]
MRIEYFLLGAVWILSFALVWFIPKSKRRRAAAAFLFKQALTYLLGLAVVEMGLLAYPVREFSEINRASFTYEFLAYPMVCALFNARYPEGKPAWVQLAYYVGYSSVLTFVEVLIEKYTDLVHYMAWNWFYTWSTLMITFFMTRLFCVWLFRGLKEREVEYGLRGK